MFFTPKKNHNLAWAVFVVLLGIAQLHGTGSKPNIVVFIADDAGMEFGCYGDRGAKTPHIDALAEKGVVFENAFLTAPQCSPSRTSMLSGQYAHTIGTEDLHTGIQEQTRLLPHYLSEAGYFTGLMLKGHIGNHGMEQFDWYDNGFWPDYARDGVWNEKAVDNFSTFLDESSDRPFFLWVGFVDPHRAYVEDRVVGNRAKRVVDPSQVTVSPYLRDDAATRLDLAHYYDEIARMDSHIGGMLEVLNQRGLRENTLVIFLSDNGKPFPRAKGTLYDSGIQTPFVVSWPGITPEGKRSKGLLSTLDLAPTLLDVAGLTAPSQMQGHSFKNRLSQPEAPGREILYAERNWHGTDEHMRAIRTDKYLLILNSYIELPHGTPSDLSSSPSWYALTSHRTELTPAQAHLFQCPRPAIELYDVKKDPFQLNNLAGQSTYLDVGKMLSNQLINWMQETGDHPPHMRRRHDVVDRITGFPIASGKQRQFFEDYWEKSIESVQETPKP